jgi:hypothetical protein
MKMKRLLIVTLLFLAGCAGDKYRYLEDTAAVDISDAPALGTPANDDKILTINTGNVAGNRLSAMTFADAPWLLTAGTGTVVARNVEDTMTDGSNIPDGAAIKAYGDTYWLGSGTGLESQPTATLQLLTSTGAGEGQYEWSTYDNLKTALGVPISGTDFYAPSAVDALLTPLAISAKLEGQAISPSVITIDPGSTGPQVIELGEDTDFGQDKFSLGAPSSMTTSYGELAPVSPPEQGQIKRYNVPTPVVGVDGVTRNMSLPYFEDPAAGNFADLLDIVSNSVTIADVIATKGATSNFQTQLTDLSDAVNAIQGFEYEPYPEYSDSPSVGSGRALSADGASEAVYVASIPKWKRIALIDDIGADPGGPVAQSFAITGSGPQIATITYDRAVTATTTADLCDDWAVELTDAGALTLSYFIGDNSSTTVCNITQDVYNTDSLVSISYTPGTIESTVGAVALGSIADFSASTTVNSSESPPSSTYFPLTDPDLESLWYFDNDATDVQGNNNLTKNGTVTYNTGTKVQGTHSAFSSGGGNNFSIDDASLVGIDFSGDFTIGGWFYVTSDYAQAKIFSKWDPTTNNREFDLVRDHIANSIIVQFSYDGGSLNVGTFAAGADTWSINTWLHLVIAHNATTHAVKLYKNGTELTSGSFPATATDVPYPAGVAKLGVKGSYYDSSREFNGYIDESFFVSRILTSSEISNLYNNGFDTGR